MHPILRNKVTSTLVALPCLAIGLVLGTVGSHYLSAASATMPPTSNLRPAETPSMVSTNVVFSKTVLDAVAAIENLSVYDRARVFALLVNMTPVTDCRFRGHTAYSWDKSAGIQLGRLVKAPGIDEYNCPQIYFPYPTKGGDQ